MKEKEKGYMSGIYQEVKQMQHVILRTKEQENFWDDVYVDYLDCEDSLMSVCACQTLANFIL